MCLAPSRPSLSQALPGSRSYSVQVAPDLGWAGARGRPGASLLAVLVPGLSPAQRRGCHRGLGQSRPGHRAGRPAPAWALVPAASASAGEQPDASLPLHVLPLYSLLSPEKQAQVSSGAG